MPALPHVSPYPCLVIIPGAHTAQMLIAALGLTINQLYHVGQSQWGQGQGYQLNNLWTDTRLNHPHPPFSVSLTKHMV